MAAHTMISAHRVLLLAAFSVCFAEAAVSAASEPSGAVPDSASAGAKAQTSTSAPAAIPDVYDEESLVRYALSHNPDLRTSRWDVNLAQASVSTASALKNPVLRGEWLHVQSREDYGFGVGVAWTPPQPGVFGAKKDAARASVSAAKDTYAEDAADVEANVRAAWAEAEAVEEQVRLVQESVRTRRAIADAVRERIAHGASSQIDLSLVTLSLARGEQERDLLSAEFEAAKARLSALSGLPPERAFELLHPEAPSGAPPAAASGTAPQSDPASPRAATTLVTHALGSRPIFRADAARLTADRAAVDAERATRWPWIELQARYRRHDQSNYPDDVTLGLEVTIPLLDRNTGRIAAAEAALSRERERSAAHRQQVERDVRFFDAERRRRSAMAEHYAEAVSTVLAEHEALVKQALQGMVLDITAVLAAEDAVAHGRIDYVATRLAARKAEIAFARASGAYTRSGRGEP